MGKKKKKIEVNLIVFKPQLVFKPMTFNYRYILAANLNLKFKRYC